LCRTIALVGLFWRS